MLQQELSWRERGRLWMRLSIRMILLTAFVLILIFLVPPLFSLFMPIVLAVVMAWLLHPVIRWIQKRLRLPRGFLSALLIVFVFSVVGGALGFFCYSAAMEIRSLAENWQSIWNSAQLAIVAVGETLDKWSAYFPQEVEDLVAQGLQEFTTWVQAVLPNALGSMASRAGNFAMSIPTFAVGSIVFVMAAFFITADYPRLRFMVIDRMPNGVKLFWGHIRKTAIDAFGGYVRAQLILSTVVFFILILGFFMIQQEYALLLALLFAVLDFIPLIGSGTVMIPWAIVDVFTGNYLHALLLTVIWGIISLFRRVAEPKILGSQTGLSPILSLVSIYLGMRLAGVLGMILGPVLCLVFQNLGKTGLFDAFASDLRLAVSDTAALLTVPPPEGPNEPRSKNTPNSFKKG